MKINDKTITTRNGKAVLFRNAYPDDAEAFIQYMNITTAETPYLIREAGEFQMSVEAEQAFLQQNLEHPRSLLMMATMDGQHVGSCSVSPLGTIRRYRHRCGIAIALYQQYCELGIGRQMLEEALHHAKAMGYEQAELDVIATNERAIHLYESLGFQKYGTFPNNLKYQDGSYADAYWMMLRL